jgi:hypothetical protein
MPTLNWAPQGSYSRPISPPLLGPNGGELVCIPPVNKDWIKVILGCLDQLRIPATWLAVDDADLLQALNWMQELKDMVASAGPCCDVAMRLQDCVLQFSTDSGGTWADVTGWADNFKECAASSIIAPVPPNPGPALPNQHACNIAGFIASEVIQKAMVLAASDIGASKNDVQYATDILAEISFAFPITFAAAVAFRDWYNGLVAELLTEVTTASTDPTLWSLVTCAIYNAIKTRGYVDASNFAAVVSNIAAITYTYAWAPGLISGFFNNLGLDNVRAMQNIGALDDVDCTDCGTWCWEYDFNFSGSPGAIIPGSMGMYVAGSPGYWTSVDAGGFQQLQLYVDLPSSQPITAIRAWAECGGAAAGGTGRLLCARDTSHTVIHCGSFSSGILEPPQAIGIGFSVTTAGELTVSYQSTGADNFPLHILKLQVQGPGPNPFGLDDCTF